MSAWGVYSHGNECVGNCPVDPTTAHGDRPAPADQARGPTRAQLTCWPGPMPKSTRSGLPQCSRRWQSDRRTLQAAAAASAASSPPEFRWGGVTRRAFRGDDRVAGRPDKDFHGASAAWRIVRLNSEGEGRNQPSTYCSAGARPKKRLHLALHSDPCRTPPNGPRSQRPHGRLVARQIDSCVGRAPARPVPAARGGGGRPSRRA